MVCVPQAACPQHLEQVLTLLQCSTLRFFQFCRYVKFDTFHPAVDRGLPVTRVISRVVLQEILAKAARKMAGKDVIINDCKVVDYTHEVRAATVFSSKQADAAASCNSEAQKTLGK